MHRNILKITLFLILCLSVQAVAQQSTYSPYSRYGIGELTFGGFGPQIAMGGLSAAYADSLHINFYNPASYSALKLTTFDVGVRGELNRLSSSTGTDNARTAAFSYLALGFPIVKDRAGIAFGLVPFSNKGYNIEQKITDSLIIGNQLYSYEGSGGINQFFLGAGFTVNKNISVGVNGSYYFGNLKTTNSVEFPDSTNFLNSRLIRTTDIGDVSASAGINIKHKISEKSNIIYGFTGTIDRKIKAQNNLLIENYFKTTSGGEAIKDTVLLEDGINGDIVFPVTFSGGIVVEHNKTWLVGADFEMQNWSDFESFGVKDSLQNSFRFSLGGQYSPQKVTGGFWSKRAVYRAGFKYYTSYLELQNTAIEEYGITFGLAIPANTTKIRGTSEKPFYSNINLSFELGKRGTTESSLIKEEYLKMTVGLTLRDKWFNPRKYD
ncbi:MAG: hypothetical protein HKO56_09450 [Bacteroidia bacterium]|nr:hypothetical protein [Bacteroidia bacterium]